jgi:hypothetical protein
VLSCTLYPFSKYMTTLILTILSPFDYEFGGKSRAYFTGDRPHFDLNDAQAKEELKFLVSPQSIHLDYFYLDEYQQGYKELMDEVNREGANYDYIEGEVTHGVSTQEESVINYEVYNIPVGLPGEPLVPIEEKAPELGESGMPPVEPEIYDEDNDGATVFLTADGKEIEVSTVNSPNLIDAANLDKRAQLEKLTSNEIKDIAVEKGIRFIGKARTIDVLMNLE